MAAWQREHRKQDCNVTYADESSGKEEARGECTAWFHNGSISFYLAIETWQESLLRGFCD